MQLAPDFIELCAVQEQREYLQLARRNVKSCSRTRERVRGLKAIDSYADEESGGAGHRLRADDQERHRMRNAGFLRHRVRAPSGDQLANGFLEYGGKAIGQARAQTSERDPALIFRTPRQYDLQIAVEYVERALAVLGFARLVLAPGARR